MSDNIFSSEEYQEKQEVTKNIFSSEEYHADPNTSEERTSDIRIEEPLPVLDKGKSLKVDDIVDTTSYVDTIRDYMVDRKGKQFLDMDKEELVDKFVAHMRYFNTNEFFTIDEVRYVSKANEGKAYQIYDKLGNVFVNDGLGGAVGGVADYIGAIISSPSTYLGLGVGKVLTAFGGKLSAEGVKMAAKKAAREAIEKQSKKVGSGKGKLSDFRRIAKEAEDDVVRKAIRSRAKKNIGITAGADALVAGVQDASLQNYVRIETGAQDEYSGFQTILSSLGAGLGTGLSIYAIPKATGASERGLSGDISKKIKRANAVKKSEIKDAKELEKLNKKYLKRVRDMAKKVKVKASPEAQFALKTKKATEARFDELIADNTKLFKQQKADLKKLYTQIKNLEIKNATQKRRKRKGQGLTDKEKADLQSLRIQARKLETARRGTFRKSQEL
jgi:hypothetical protein